ncbi:mannitol dehydrogenase family protein [Natronospirillum operosum]|uniref:Mannitol dehydrogenase family protein n=1 Tax=Natronospirillum operosum TaxID=2759953 RepID=A0A4Z0WAM3_9GAMM|nr:mannitol dehydrogenase family protein [Natronospirillum operosum]TGG94239.1 mannitol dehydrogenase family protein [Natronospirillum operosum]
MTSIQAYYRQTANTGPEGRSLLPGIVHVGVGAFHRAHQAWYLERLNRLHQQEVKWGISGIGLLAGDSDFLHRLEGQDCLYTLTLVDQAQRDTWAIGAITEVIAAAEDRARALARLASPDTRIISTTITEGGYLYDFETDQFIAEHPAVVHDLANPEAPQSLFGYLLLALRLRRDRNAGPVTLLSCDNVPGNGSVFRQALTAFVRLAGDEALLHWMQSNVSFPNSMVDRITPTPTAELAADVAARTEVDDACPVLGESFAQWVVEDDFIAGRPALEQVGVEFTPHVAHYERLKLRILNGTHITVSCIGRMLGLTYIHEAMEDSLLGPLARQLMDQDAHAGIGHFSDAEIDTYKDTIVHRFANPAIADSIDRVASDGFSKLKNYLMPILRDCLNRGQVSPRLALAFACYLRHLEGRNDHGEPVVINEPALSESERQHFPGRVKAFLRLPQFLGQDDSAPARAFIAETERLHDSLVARGTAATLLDISVSSVV